MSKFWSPLVNDLVPYVPGEQPKMANLVKLNTNENPFGPSQAAQEAVRRVVHEMHRYPSSDHAELRQAIGVGNIGNPLPVW